MSASNQFHQIANNALISISEHCLPGTKITLVIYTPGKPEQDIVLKDRGLDDDEVVSTLRRRGLSVDGDNAYKRDLCDVIVGALMLGKQSKSVPPAGHWARRFWDIGRAEGQQRDDLVWALVQVADCLSLALTGGAVSAKSAGAALVRAAEMIELHRA